MKKILICAIAFSLLCAVAVGCAKRPQSSETDSSSVTSSQANDSSSTRVVDEFDPVKEVVENFFNDYKGYWLNSAGEYVLFKTEEDGSCILEKYSSDGKLMSTREIIEIAATNKTSYAAKSADSKVFTFEIFNDLVPGFLVFSGFHEYSIKRVSNLESSSLIFISRV